MSRRDDPVRLQLDASGRFHGASSEQVDSHASAPSGRDHT